MEGYKQEFIDFLLETNALKIGPDFSLKSKRLSPYFINVGDFNDGLSTARLGEAYAQTIINSGKDFDLVYGIPEKGVALAIATSIGLGKLGKNKPWFFTRKIPKEYGEATNLTKAEKRKALIVGRAPQDGQKLIVLDDVFTTGDTKYQSKALLDELLDNTQYPALAIAVDRQEVGIDGKSAIEKFTQDTQIPVIAIVKTTEIYEHLKIKPDKNQKDIERIRTYLRVYGTDEAKKQLGRIPEQTIIERDRSVIPACDVDTIEQFEELVKQTADVEGIGGYKIGFELGLGHGLSKVVEVARKHTDKPIIYDHQKAGTDIPDTGKNFARVCKKAGVDAVILFPQSGPETERAWIYHALDYDLNVIIGGRMTHPAYTVSEGGFISDEGALEMYRIAARAGVNNFVVPGNKPNVIRLVKEVVVAEGADPVFFGPGLGIGQGGDILDAKQESGRKFHGIVGRGIYQAPDIRKAAIEHTSQL